MLFTNRYLRQGRSELSSSSNIHKRQAKTISSTQQNNTGTDSSSSGLRKFAATVSAVFSPPLLTTLMLAIVGFKLNNREAWIWLVSYALISTLVPSVMIYWMVRQGTVSDFHMRNRDERGRPLLVIFLLSASLSVVFLLAGAPRVITALTVGAAIQALVMWRVTSKWKISGHSAAAGSFLAIILALNASYVIPALILLALVIWARVLRDRHTLMQSLAGALLGFASIGLPLLYIMPLCTGPVLACV